MQKAKNVTFSAVQPQGLHIALDVSLLPGLVVPWVYEPRKGGGTPSKEFKTSEVGAAIDFMESLKASLASIRVAGAAAKAPHIARGTHFWTKDQGAVLINESPEWWPSMGASDGLQVPPTGYTARVPAPRLIALLSEAIALVHELAEGKPAQSHRPQSMAFVPSEGVGCSVVVEVAAKDDGDRRPHWAFEFAAGDGTASVRVPDPSTAPAEQWAEVADGAHCEFTVANGDVRLRVEEGSAIAPASVIIATNLSRVKLSHGDFAPQFRRALAYAKGAGLFE